MKVRPLTKPLQEKAIAELNEIPHQIEENLNNFKGWLDKQEHLKYRHDDQLLLNFLRSSKFSIERAKEKIDAYYSFRTLAPEIGRDLDPLLPNVREALNFGFVFPLAIPKEDPASPLVFIIRYREYDPDEVTCPILLKTSIIVSEVLFNESDNVIVSGLKVIWDMKGIHFKTALQSTPTFIKKLIHIYIKGYPIRVKGVYMINVPTYFESIMNMVKRLLSEKNARRIHIYSTANMEEIYRHVPKSILPTEYGGDAGPVHVLAAKMKNTLDNYREKLLNENNYFTDESKRIGDQNTTDTLFGVEGSFKKLEID